MLPSKHDGFCLRRVNRVALSGKSKLASCSKGLKGHVLLIGPSRPVSKPVTHPPENTPQWALSYSAGRQHVLS